jgi:sugar lactone lactonase YvrE
MLLILTLLPHQWEAAAQAEDTSRYFPETGKTVSGKFLEYWQSNGGLATFGYPLTEAQSEVSATDGQSYLTQWFERNRFERHPAQAGTSYEIQLGLLGLELKAEARNVDPDFVRTSRMLDSALPTDQQWYFEQTGHNLRFRFLQYWLANGGLTRFGYPISEEYHELDPESNQVYLTQWFERARFEYHPLNQPAQQIQLGLLGKQLKFSQNKLLPVWKTGPAYNDPILFTGLTVDRDGNSYLADLYTGNLLKYGPDGQLANRWDKAICNELPVSNPVLYIYSLAFGSGVATDKQGNIYITYSDAKKPSVRKYNTQGQLLLEWGERGSGNGQFYAPNSITVDNQGNIYVADTGTIENIESRVQKFDSQGHFLASIGEKGRITPPDKIPPAAYLKYVGGMAIDSQNNLYVLDLPDFSTENYIVKKYDPQGNFLLGWGNKGTADGQFGISDFAFARPVGIAIDPKDNIYVADLLNQRIQKFDSNGLFLSKITPKFSKDAAAVAMPFAIATDQQGNLYITSYGSNHIQKLAPDGQLLLEFGSRQNLELTPQSYSSMLTGALGNLYVVIRDNYGLQSITKYYPDGRIRYKIEVNDKSAVFPFSYPYLDDKENLYLLSYNNYIQKLNPDGKLILTLGGVGTGESQFTPPPPDVENSGKVPPAGPRALAVDQQGNIFTIDQISNQIFKFNSQGKLLLKFAGSGSGEGQLGRAPNYPAGLYSTDSLQVDAQGNLYVLDNYNYRIQKFDNNAHFLLKIGSKGVEDGQFNSPQYFRLDPSGNFYVWDYNGPDLQRLQKFSPTGNFLYKLEFQHSNVQPEQANPTLKFDPSNYSFKIATSAATEATPLFNSFQLDRQGNLYILGALPTHVRKLNSEGQLLADYSPLTDRQVTAAPPQIAIDPLGNLYIMDDFNLYSRISKFWLR